MLVLGIEMVTQAEVGKIIGTNSQATVSEWLAKAGLAGIPLKKKKYYSVEAIKDYLRYGKVELRQAIELLREAKMLNLKRRKENEK